jgi:hypothetical protein
MVRSPGINALPSAPEPGTRRFVVPPLGGHARESAETLELRTVRPPKGGTTNRGSWEALNCAEQVHCDHEPAVMLGRVTPVRAAVCLRRRQRPTARTGVTRPTRVRKVGGSWEVVNFSENVPYDHAPQMTQFDADNDFKRIRIKITIRIRNRKRRLMRRSHSGRHSATMSV